MGLSDKWKATVNDGLTNAAWDAYDATIKAEVEDYNKRLARTTGYVAVDWKLVKALLWVESGGPTNAAWTTRPMQIGNPGDPAYGVVKDGKESASVVMSEQLKKDIKGNISNPSLNVRAGIAYLFAREATTSLESVLDPVDTKTFTYIVLPGDSLDKIASRVGSTMEVLKQLNPTARILQPKQTIIYRKASIKRAIRGWSPFDSKTVARLYNVGDPDYSAKLDYVLALFPKLNR
jgi:LysM repeat protein